MELKKISLDIDSELYVRIKHDVFDKKITMSDAIREVLKNKWGDKRNGNTGTTESN